jgi:NADH-ubiquinone oxidoreductase chain 5
MAGLSAIFECDIKKIIALSTLRQLGVIIGAIGLSLPLLRFFHLITHAIFKALLFITAGYLISLFQHTQDLRIIGSLIKQLPLTSSATLLSIIALCGAPFIAGFYSKDIILEIILFNPTNLLITFIFIAATALTIAYSARTLIIVIWSPSISSPLLPTNDETTNAS